MNRILIIKRQLLKKVLMIMGVCSAGFIAACAKYGTITTTICMNLKGIVRSKDLAQPVKGIKVDMKCNKSDPDITTDSNGTFSITTEANPDQGYALLHFSDIDGTANGSFQPKDTIIHLSTSEIEAKLKENLDIRLVRNE